MKRAITLLIIIALMAGSLACTRFMTKSDQRISALTKNRDSYGSIRLEYRSYSQLSNELRNKAEVQLLTEEQISVQKSILPAGGELIVYIDRFTIDEASTEWFTVIVKDGGEEIVRKQGEESVPDFTVFGNYTNWWDLMIVDLPPHSEHFIVYVIDALNNQRYEFSVDEVPLE